MFFQYSFKSCSSKQIIDYGNAIIELVEDVYTDDDDLNYALRQRERYYILNTPNTVNIRLPSQFRINKDYRKNYNEANKEKLSQKKREYYEANKDKIAQKKREYYEANKDKYAQYVINYLQAKRIRMKEEKIREFQEANEEKRMEIVKEFIIANNHRTIKYKQEKKIELEEKAREKRRLKKEQEQREKEEFIHEFRRRLIGTKLFRIEGPLANLHVDPPLTVEELEDLFEAW